MVLQVDGLDSVANYRVLLRSCRVSVGGPLSYPETVRVAAVELTDATGVTGRGARSVRVTAVNDPPVWNVGTLRVALVEEESRLFEGLLAATDPEALPVSYEVVCMGGKVEVEMDAATGAFRLTGALNAYGSETMVVRARRSAPPLAPIVPPCQI